MSALAEMDGVIDLEVEAIGRSEAARMALQVLRKTTGLRFAVIARVTEDSWTACATLDEAGFGIGPGHQLVQPTTFCSVVRSQLAPLILPDVSADEFFTNHPAHAMYGVESYIAVPLLRRDGSYFGVLCALDRNPSALIGEHLAVFQLLSSLISFELEADEQHRHADRQLAEEREEAMARERLIGILGHDLRTPLTAITLGADELVRNGGLRPVEQNTALGILASAKRSARMVRELLDFTRARLGGGIPIRPDPIDLQRVVEKVLSEIRAGGQAEQIRFLCAGDCHGSWDADRAAQVVANLAGNALQHRQPETPVDIVLTGLAGSVTLEVSNTAAPLSSRELADLFSPFRGPALRGRTNPDGLGLGLFIVREIMRAHNGSIEAIAGDGRITFRATWPR